LVVVLGCWIGCCGPLDACDPRGASVGGWIGVSVVASVGVWIGACVSGPSVAAAAGVWIGACVLGPSVGAWVCWLLSVGAWV